MWKKKIPFMDFLLAIVLFVQFFYRVFSTSGMVFPILPFLLAYVDIIPVPTDSGANMRGAALAPKTLLSLGLKERLQKSQVVPIATERGDPRDSLQNVFDATSQSLKRGHIPLVLGGDHSVAIGSVAATLVQSQRDHKKLGVLWCDAHADFNTLETSPTKNIHGMCLAVLCHHTLPQLQFFDRGMSVQDVLQFGVRDVDGLEFMRIQDYNLAQTNSLYDVERWVDEFDMIHVSFDMDVLEPSLAPGVSTPVPGGISKSESLALMSRLRRTRKVVSADFVELNPLNDVNNRTANLCIDLIEMLMHDS
jgi:arginase